MSVEGKRVLITGTSRGVGAEAAVAFAKAGADIVGTYVNPDPHSSKRQDRTIKACLAVNPNGQFTSVRVDITQEADRRVMFEVATGGTSHPEQPIDVVVLNAAGGLEEGSRGDDWADRINRQAQISIVQEALPYLSPNATILYMQSLWSHNYGKTKQLAIYESVASTKHAAELDLRAMIPELGQRGVRVGVLVADIIEGTGVFSLFKRMMGDEFLEIGKQIEGGFPTTERTAGTLVEMASTEWKSGYTKYLGRRELEPFDTSIYGKEFNRFAIALMLPMYDDTSLLVDTFKVNGMNEGEATYTVREQEWGHHFVGPYGQIKLEPAHYLAEIAALPAGLLVGHTRFIGTGAPLYTGVTGDFERMVFPNEKIRTLTKVERAISGGIVCSSQVFGQDGTRVANFDRIKFQILPTYDVGWRMYRKEREARGMAPIVEEK